MKGRRWVSVLPVCPLYKYTEPQSIGCDGEEYSTLHITFPDRARRNDYLARYCRTDYQKCPVYTAFFGGGE